MKEVSANTDVPKRLAKKLLYGDDSPTICSRILIPKWKVQKLLRFNEFGVKTAL